MFILCMEKESINYVQLVIIEYEGSRNVYVNVGKQVSPKKKVLHSLMQFSLFVPTPRFKIIKGVFHKNFKPRT